jgi:ATP-dependent Clp protease ATP-binding subunit ClpA
MLAARGAPDSNSGAGGSRGASASGGSSGSNSGTGGGGGPPGSSSSSRGLSALSRYTRDLTDEARRGLLDPVIGRQDVMARTLQVGGWVGGWVCRGMGV